ncbi:hypothetical protein CCHR01_01838 [Colletotrichum chrysophilum]|uniref:Uncharacterized protein n=1 Tax=Colletotrichum chrysophilum TaxID=1836956 RepID=A0AAD9B1A7_9PEZI|nr:hypothetical protein CCHR01_01838 [Colletotrichum chrysophilum]
MCACNYESVCHFRPSEEAEMLDGHENCRLVAGLVRCRSTGAGSVIDNRHSMAVFEEMKRHLACLTCLDKPAASSQYGTNIDDRPRYPHGLPATLPCPALRGWHKNTPK